MTELNILKYFAASSKIYLLVFIVLVVSSSGMARTNFPLINSAYKYNTNAQVKCNYHLAAMGDSVHLYLKINVKNGRLVEDYKMGYELKEFYGEKNIETVDSINIQNFIIGIKKNSYYLKIPLTVQQGVNMALLYIQEKDGTSFYYDILLDLQDKFAPSGLVVVSLPDSLPVFQDYIYQNGKYAIVDSFRKSESMPLHIYKYNQIFSAAYPPMASGADPNKTLEIDSVFSVNSAANLQLSDEALYFVQTDTTSFKGLAFRVVPAYYPDFKKAEELISPLIYISTKSEMARLTKAKDFKKALDKYWLDLINNPGRARNTIKSFYDQIEIANQLFTTYKEGWKTDQGMIYSLYGAPDEVYFDGSEEQWIYKKSDDISRVKFTFVKIKNIFTEQHFELMRNKSYESFWFGNVELWRKGIKNL
jgi:GWxTD domain-containing protein